MSKTLREKGSKGVFWSIIDNAGNYGVQFIVGIVLARILSPEEFGLVGLITVVVTLMTPFIDSGFSIALIRKNNCTQSDYSTVFIFNIIVSILIYFVVFFSSPIVSSFYNEPQLTNLLRVLAIVIIIDSFGLIQQTILIKNVDFKKQSFISIISSTISGGVSIVLANKGFGVWSLVYRSLLNSFIKSLLLWVFNKWIPSFVFNIKAFKDFFAFGSKLLLASFINQLQKQFSYIIIGKFYSPTDLGFFTRAGQFQQLPTALLMSTFGKVSMPLLAEIKDNDQRLRVSFSKLLQTVMFASIPIILLMAAVAKPMIVLLIGEKWLPSVIYLQLMCFSGKKQGVRSRITNPLIFLYNLSLWHAPLDLNFQMLYTTLLLVVTGAKIFTTTTQTELFFWRH